mmetsp:Transcript_27882/g.32222  ORF Transcript_27882/g.32222 Transcript_27882/m.32222 type:complete len:86 (+) Transcript_27882:263-520(+)
MGHRIGSSQQTRHTLTGNQLHSFNQNIKQKYETNKQKKNTNTQENPQQYHNGRLLKAAFASSHKKTLTLTSNQTQNKTENLPRET